MNKLVINAAAAVVLGFGFFGGTAWARGGDDGSRCDVAPAAEVDQAKRPQPKALSDQVKKGLKWLSETQLENGAWGQGEESAQMGTGDSKLKTTANVADTCMAVMAFVRSGNMPGAGDYKQNVNRAVAFLCAQVEESDDKSLFITTLRGTRTQGKLGQPPAHMKPWGCRKSLGAHAEYFCRWNKRQMHKVFCAEIKIILFVVRFQVHSPLIVSNGFHVTPCFFFE